MTTCTIIYQLKTQGFSLYTNLYQARPIFIDYRINTGSIQIKARSRKNERNKPSMFLSRFHIFHLCFRPVSIFFVNTETIGSNIENGTDRYFNSPFSTLNSTTQQISNTKRTQRGRVLHSRFKNQTRTDQAPNKIAYLSLY